MSTQPQRYFLRAQKSGLMLHHGLVVLVVLMLVLAQLLPVSAYPSGGVSIVAETCDQTTLRVNPPRNEANEGVLGQYSFISGLDALLPVHGLTAPRSCLSDVTYSGQNMIVASAEPYWVANRGPPESKEKAMNFSLSFYTYNSAEFLQNPRGFPWA